MVLHYHGTTHPPVVLATQQPNFPISTLLYLVQYHGPTLYHGTWYWYTPGTHIVIGYQYDCMESSQKTDVDRLMFSERVSFLTKDTRRIFGIQHWAIRLKLLAN